VRDGRTDTVEVLDLFHLIRSTVPAEVYFIHGTVPSRSTIFSRIAKLPQGFQEKNLVHFPRSVKTVMGKLF